VKYPLYREARENLRLPSGRPIDAFSSEQLRDGELGPEDLGIHQETLRRQARIAEDAGFVSLARNLERAAELTRVPAEKILEIYEALRRGQSAAEIARLATELEETYEAKATAAFIREATEPASRQAGGAVPPGPYSRSR
jgi:propanediol dehydratase small subunit